MRVACRARTQGYPLGTGEAIVMHKCQVPIGKRADAKRGASLALDGWKRISKWMSRDIAALYSCRHMNSSLPYSVSRLLLACPPILFQGDCRRNLQQIEYVT